MLILKEEKLIDWGTALRKIESALKGSTSSITIGGTMGKVFVVHGKDTDYFSSYTPKSHRKTSKGLEVIERTALGDFKNILSSKGVESSLGDITQFIEARLLREISIEVEDDSELLIEVGFLPAKPSSADNFLNFYKGMKIHVIKDIKAYQKKQDDFTNLIFPNR